MIFNRELTETFSITGCIFFFLSENEQKSSGNYFLPKNMTENQMSASHSSAFWLELPLQRYSRQATTVKTNHMFWRLLFLFFWGFERPAQRTYKLFCKICWGTAIYLTRSPCLKHLYSFWSGNCWIKVSWRGELVLQRRQQAAIVCGIREHDSHLYCFSRERTSHLVYSTATVIVYTSTEIRTTPS